MEWGPTERLTLSLFTKHCSFKLFLTLPGPFLKVLYLFVFNSQKTKGQAITEGLSPCLCFPEVTGRETLESGILAPTYSREQWWKMQGTCSQCQGPCRGWGKSKWCHAKAVFPSLFFLHYHSFPRKLLLAFPNCPSSP